MATTADDRRYMTRALELAERGRYRTRPNPTVGCVIVKDGLIVGEGFTAPAGGPHAEIHALAQAGDRARDATVYVTLEPCAHQGRTPPCTEALIASRARRVVGALEDPHPAAGGGFARLEAAGIETTRGVLASEALDLNAGFVSRCVRGRPFVRLKLAATLDGRTAMASGESKWITGPAARRDVHALRARSGAIVTGVGTVLADDPGLGPRREELDELLDSEDIAFLEARPPLRVVLDTTLRTPPKAKLFAAPGKVLLAAAEHAASEDATAPLKAAGADVLALPRDADGVPLEEVLEELGRRDCNDALLECGPRLAGHALERGLVDELWLYQAPRLLGSTARPLIDLELEALAESIDLDLKSVRRVGDDLRLVLTPRPR